MTTRPRVAPLARQLAGRVLAAALGAALAAPAALAAAPRDPESLPIAPGGSGPGGVADGAGGTILRMGVGLAVVLLLIGAVWYVLRRVRAARYPETDARGTSLIDVLATTPLGPNRNLHLVRVGNEVVVIGATEHSVTPVARLAGDQVEALALDLGAPDARGAFTPSAGSRRPDARYRAPAASRDASVLDRLRALTTRR